MGHKIADNSILWVAPEEKDCHRYHWKFENKQAVMRLLGTEWTTI